jgi:hypothetical protein
MLGMQGLYLAAVLALLLPVHAFADCQHDGKVEGEGGVIKFDDGILRQCENSAWVKTTEVLDPSKIHIRSANYGVDTPPVSCDPSGNIKRDCEGKSSCSFPITNEYMCGRDVLRGPGKRLLMSWQCGGKPGKDENQKERPSGPNFLLSCP